MYFRICEGDIDSALCGLVCESMVAAVVDVNARVKVWARAQNILWKIIEKGYLIVFKSNGGSK